MLIDLINQKFFGQIPQLGAVKSRMGIFYYSAPITVFFKLVRPEVYQSMHEFLLSK